MSGEDPDQLLCSLIRIFAVCILDSQGCIVFATENEDSNQAARMCRLIWVFTGRTYTKVRFLR